MARIGIIGGSFDPVHYGHLLLAECGREQCALDEVWFIPTYISPFKQAGSQASKTQRRDMLTLAIASHPSFSINDIEWLREGVSYTCETLEALTEKHPEHEFLFLLGADSLADFADWKKPQQICKLATLAIVSRPGSPPPNLNILSPFADAEYLEQVADAQITMPAMDLSSSNIRKLVGSQQSIRYRLPRAVEQYIATEKLYQDEF
ncbi:MAG: nicotinate (nicotinamide) nucleotide adenylyltransferase [Planctomycetaceae bacterium]|nr:nicotinate (nicotinamide) nucleotide adenylyltransferase [Planctomycetaceae bacterium]|tara:strand:- start:2722 stop:3339 length:618 start_codon:yes stop_codon:yes gene_type:complete